MFTQSELSMDTLLKPDNKINQSDSFENNFRIYTTKTSDIAHCLPFTWEQ